MGEKEEEDKEAGEVVKVQEEGEEKRACRESFVTLLKRELPKVSRWECLLPPQVVVKRWREEQRGVEGKREGRKDGRRKGKRGRWRAGWN